MNLIPSCQVYTVEVSSKEMRGTLSMMEAVLRCTGTLMVYSLALAFRWSVSQPDIVPDNKYITSLGFILLVAGGT